MSSFFQRLHKNTWNTLMRWYSFPKCKDDLWAKKRLWNFYWKVNFSRFVAALEKLVAAAKTTKPSKHYGIPGWHWNCNDFYGCETCTVVSVCLVLNLTKIAVSMNMTLTKKEKLQYTVDTKNDCRKHPEMKAWGAAVTSTVTNDKIVFNR